MSNFKQFVRKAVPIVLTVVGSASTIAAVIFAAKEGPKYQKILEEKGDEIKPIEKVTTAIKVFAPAIGCAATSIACGVGTYVFDFNTQMSIMGIATAAERGYKTLLKKNEEINGPGANEKIFKSIAEENFPEDISKDPPEKVYTVHLRNLSDNLDEITFESTKEDLLWKVIAVNMEMGKIGSLTLNRLLEMFELGQYKTSSGDNEGWSFAMLGEWDGNEWLMFDYIHGDDGSLTCYPIFGAYDGFLSDYGLDWPTTGPELIEAMNHPVL